MEKLWCLVALCFLSFSVVTGQTNKEQLPGKFSEQKEMNATKHLEKEIQQKQLSDKPEMLAEGFNKHEMKKKDEMKKKRSENGARTRKYTKRSSVRQN